MQIDQKGTIINDVCDIFVNACGILNNWTWPDIEGLFDFKGHLVHSARWDDSYDFTGKTVCVIGNGSTGLQIVPNLQKVVKKMVAIIRSPTWISPTYVAHKSKVDKGKNFECESFSSLYEVFQSRKLPLTFLQIQKKRKRNSGLIRRISATTAGRSIRK